MNLPNVVDAPIEGKRVVLRTDYDVPLKSSKFKVQNSKLEELEVLKNGEIADDSRIVNSLETIKFLLSKNCAITVISHLGRPAGKIVPELSLKPMAERLKELVGEKVEFVQDINLIRPIGPISPMISLLENLRFWPGEENNDENFARQLTAFGDVYVNEAFAVSHREHASIVGLSKLLPSFFGLNLVKEIETLEKVLKSPKRPVVLILGGAKEDKLDYIEKLNNWTDFILVGGKLPKLINDLPQHQSVRGWQNSEKILLAELNEEGKDITLESVNKFIEVIAKAGTVVWAGPLGIAEDVNFRDGTETIAKAVVGSNAYTILGGGDTEGILTQLGLVDKINFVSSGGGAMLEFLANGTLPGIEAVISK